MVAEISAFFLWSSWGWVTMHVLLPEDQMDLNGVRQLQVTRKTTLGDFAHRQVEIHSVIFWIWNLIAIVVIFCEVSGCGEFWDAEPFGVFCYQFNFQSSLTWVQARDACRQQNAELLSITTPKEQAWIAGNHPNVSFHSCLISLHLFQRLFSRKGKDCHDRNVAWTQWY